MKNTCAFSRVVKNTDVCILSPIGDSDYLPCHPSTCSVKKELDKLALKVSIIDDAVRKTIEEISNKLNTEKHPCLDKIGLTALRHRLTTARLAATSEYP